MMFDMAPEVASIFFKENGDGKEMTGKEMTAKSGIDHLCPGATIDETAFTPCGYSMNAILHDSYFTIHITPEKECSYASFETNTCLRDYASMVRNVLNVFRPKRFVITMFGDEGEAHPKSSYHVILRKSSRSLFGVIELLVFMTIKYNLYLFSLIISPFLSSSDAMDSIPYLPTDAKKIPVPGFGVFARTSLASTKVITLHCGRDEKSDFHELSTLGTVCHS